MVISAAFSRFWCSCTLCDSNVVATFTWLQFNIKAIISYSSLLVNVFFIIYAIIQSALPVNTARRKNLQMWITSNSPTLFVV